MVVARNRRIFPVLLIILGLLLTAYGRTAVAQQTRVANFTVTAGLSYSQGVWRAVDDQYHYLKQAGLDVNWRFFGSGAEASQAVASGTAPIGLMAETPAISLRAAGVPVAVLAQFTDYTAATELFVSKQFHISKPSDLYGLRLAVLSGSSGDMFLGQMERVYGLDASKMRIVNLSPPDAIAAYAQKQIDGGIYWEPWPTAAGQKRPTQILENGQYSFFPSNRGQQAVLAPSFGVIVANEKFVRDNPQTIHAFLLALVNEQKFIQQHVQESIDLYARSVNENLVLTAATAKATPVSLTLPSSLSEGFALVGNYLLKGGRIKSYPPLTGWLYSEPLKQILPEAVHLEGTWSP